MQDLRWSAQRSVLICGCAASRAVGVCCLYHQKLVYVHIYACVGISHIIVNLSLLSHINAHC